MRAHLLLLTLVILGIPSSDCPSARWPGELRGSAGPAGQVGLRCHVFAQGRAIVAYVQFNNVNNDTIDILEGAPYFSPWLDWPTDQGGITFIGGHALSARKSRSPDPNAPRGHRGISLAPGQQCEIPVILQSYCGAFTPGHHRISYVMAVPYVSRAELPWSTSTVTLREPRAIISSRRVPSKIQFTGELEFEVK